MVDSHNSARISTFKRKLSDHLFQMLIHDPCIIHSSYSHGYSLAT